ILRELETHVAKTRPIEVQDKPRHGRERERHTVPIGEAVIVEGNFRAIVVIQVRHLDRAIPRVDLCKQARFHLRNVAERDKEICKAAMSAAAVGLNDSIGETVSIDVAAGTRGNHDASVLNLEDSLAVGRDYGRVASGFVRSRFYGKDKAEIVELANTSGRVIAGSIASLR